MKEFDINTPMELLNTKRAELQSKIKSLKNELNLLTDIITNKTKIEKSLMGLDDKNLIELKNIIEQKIATSGIESQENIGKI